MSAGETYVDVTAEVGAAVNSDHFEFTAERATTAVKLDGGGTRATNKDEAIRALDAIKLKILADESF